MEKMEHILAYLMEHFQLISLSLVAVVLILLFVMLFRQGSAGRKAMGHEAEGVKRALRDETESLRAALSREVGQFRGEMNESFDRVRASVDNKLRDIEESNSKKLDEMRKVVDEKLQETLSKRLDDSFKTVSERLEKVHQGLGEMQGLAQNVGDLKKALINVKTRGSYGEIQLERLLMDVFADSQYEKNFPILGGSDRVEFALKLPGKDYEGPVYLPIDSKFPIEDYERLQSAYELGDREGIQEAQKGIESSIKKSAKEIREKYIGPPRTTDFGLLFLPIEGLYAEVLRIPGLVETVQSQYHINVAGPTTLLALLNALQMGFNTLAIEKRSSEVWTILSAVKKEFAAFGGVLAKTQERIQQAGDEMDKLVGVRTRQIMRRLKNVESLPDAEATALLGMEEEAEEADESQD
ncbi:MAG: DNA recombination protein RmuC [Clostridia bacterium]|nr:DNA recombination protein RmuC [Clostridia bacterium]